MSASNMRQIVLQSSITSYDHHVAVVTVSASMITLCSPGGGNRVKAVVEGLGYVGLPLAMRAVAARHEGPATTPTRSG